MCARSIGLPHWHVGPHATLLQVGATARTWLMCTPSERWTPLQERQMKQPRLADALVHEPASSATNKRTGQRTCRTGRAAMQTVLRGPRHLLQRSPGGIANAAVRADAVGGLTQHLR